MSKASNGSGTITKLDKGRFRAAIFVPLASGEKKRKYKVFGTKKEARDWLTDMRTAIKSGRPVLDAEIKLGDWVRQWIEKYAVVTIRDSTRMNYDSYIKHLEKHEINGIPLCSLTTDKLQDFINFLIRNGRLDTGTPLSAKTVRNLMNMIHAALKQAVGNGLLISNPADYVRLPKAETAEITSLDEQDIKAMTTATIGDPWQIAFIVMTFAGLRLGELCALRHSDVLFEGELCYLNVSKSLNRVTNYDAEPGDKKTLLRLQDVKSKKSRRKVPLLPEISQMVKAHMARQTTNAESCFGVYEPDPFIVANDMGGFVDPGTVRKYLKAKAVQCGIEDFHPHCCRHTYASQAIRCGVPLLTVSETMGHSSPSVSARFYIHSDIKAQANELQAMSGLALNTLNL